MCGIFFSIGHGEALEPDEEILASLRARGPDALQTVHMSLEPTDESISTSVGISLTFCSSVLALRGQVVQTQPLVDPATGSIFCWNGEAWKYRGDEVLGNDTRFIFDALLFAVVSPSPSDQIADVLSAISGPFAFLFYDALSKTIYYGRDRLGRRSLLLDQPDPRTLTLCSISTRDKQSLSEVDASTLHAMFIENGRIELTTLNWVRIPPAIAAELPSSTISNMPTIEAVDSLTVRLSEALRVRVLDIPRHADNPHTHPTAHVAILFSGGLDCSLLARLVHDILPTTEPIDLLNVAFENPRSLQNSTDAVSRYELCPDRLTGRASFTELANTCATRLWRFVAIDIPYSYTLVHRLKIIRLMHPHNTEMDLSIAMALYFAARGIGHATLSTSSSSTSEAYQSPARVLLSGLGADELFGGYSRHATAFTHSSYAGLVAELSLDFTRIGRRNLGRDDRVMSHWGKEVRYPYLDEDFVTFALELPVWEKCGFRPGKQIPKHYDEAARAEKEEDLDPAKMLLRMAAWGLGMKGVAREKKRAIQFGARTAKMEIGKGRRKGTDVIGAD